MFAFPQLWLTSDVCILILVLNAAALCPTIPPLLPSHVFRHYTYLRDALPHLIPHIAVSYVVSPNISLLNQIQWNLKISDTLGPLDTPEVSLYRTGSKQVFFRKWCLFSSECQFEEVQL